MKIKLSSFFFVNLAAVYILFTLFIFTPILADEISRNSMILIVSFFAAAGHIASSYLLRNEHPAVWLMSLPLEIIVICILANINNDYIVKALEFYGIYSVYSTERDVVLTAVPYYIDAFFFASFVLSAREVVFIPIYYYFRSKASKAVSKTVTDAQEE